MWVGLSVGLLVSYVVIRGHVRNLVMARRVSAEIVILLAFSVSFLRGQHNFAHHTTLCEEHLTRGVGRITLNAGIMNQKLRAFLVDLHRRYWKFLALT